MTTIVILLVIGIINFIIATFIYIFGYRLSNKYYLSAKYLAYTFWGLALWSWSLLDYQENLQIKFGYFQDMFDYFIIWIRFLSTGFALYTILMFAITWGENSNFDIRKYRFLKWTAIICNTIILIPGYGLVVYGETEPLRGSFGNIILLIYTLSYFLLFSIIISKKYRQTRLYKTKKYMKVLLYAIYTAVVLAMISNLFIPLIFKTYVVSYLGPMFLMLVGVVIVFAMYRYEIFGIKKSFSNTLMLLSITMGMFLIRIVFNFLRDQRLTLFDIVSTGLFFMVNIFLIREVYYGAKKQIILDRKKIQLDSLLRVKNSFMQIASHQLRTPLTVVMGYLSMLVDAKEKKYVLSKETKEDLEKVYISSKNLNEIINDLLFATDINMGKFTLNIKDKVTLNKVVKDIIEDKQYLFDEKKTVVIYKEEGDREEILIDQPKIKEAINNVLDNAVYYGKGKIWITVDSKDKENVNVKIRDNGVGISKEDAKKIWKKFERGANSPLINPNGSGLGLYLAKIILTKHGGDIIVESKGQDQGTLVTFRIPKDTERYASKDSFKQKS